MARMRVLEQDSASLERQQTRPQLRYLCVFGAIDA